MKPERRLSPQDMHAFSMRLWNEEAEWSGSDVKALYDHARQLEADIRDREYRDAVKTFIGMTVHHSDDTDMPSIHVACLDWTRPYFVPASGIKLWPDPPHPEVYRTDEGDLYTFEARLVTCQACKAESRLPVIEVWTVPPEVDNWENNSKASEAIIAADPSLSWAMGYRPRVEEGRRVITLVCKDSDPAQVSRVILGKEGVIDVVVRRREGI